MAVNVKSSALHHSFDMTVTSGDVRALLSTLERLMNDLQTVKLFGITKIEAKAEHTTAVQCIVVFNKQERIKAHTEKVCIAIASWAVCNSVTLLRDTVSNTPMDKKDAISALDTCTNNGTAAGPALAPPAAGPALAPPAAGPALAPSAAGPALAPPAAGPALAPPAAASGAVVCSLLNAKQ
jgi:hypothetical protein